MPRTLRRIIGRFHTFVFGSVLIGSLAWAAGPGRSLVKPLVVTDIAGDVDVSIEGAARDFRIDSILPLPARIVTGEDGAMAIRQEKTTVSIAPESDIEIPAAAHDGQLIARMVQHRGNAFYDVETREVGRLHVETPYLVAVVKGTQFNVAVQGSTSTISLFEGRLEIRNPDGGGIVDLEAGEIAIRSAGEAAIRVVRMDDDALPTPDGTAAARPADAADDFGTAAVVGRLSGGLDGGELELGARASLSPGVDAGVLVEPDLTGAVAGIDLAKSGALDLGATELGLDTGVDLGAGSADVGLDVGVDLGGASADLGLDTGVDLGGGSADVGLDAGVDLGGAGADLGLDTGVDLGGGSADVGLDAGVDVGDTGADLDADVGTDGIDVDAGLDLGGTDIDVGVDLGGEDPIIDIDIGGEPEEDTGVVGGLLNRLL